MGVGVGVGVGHCAAVDDRVHPPSARGRRVGVRLGHDLGMDVQAVVTEIAAGRQMERRLPGNRLDVGEVGLSAAGRVRAIDKLLSLAELDVVVAVGREDQPSGDIDDLQIQDLGRAVVPPVQVRPDRMVRFSGLVHLGQEVETRGVPVTRRAVDPDPNGSDLADVRSSRPRRTDGRDRDDADRGDRQGGPGASRSLHLASGRSPPPVEQEGRGSEFAANATPNVNSRASPGSGRWSAHSPRQRVMKPSQSTLATLLLSGAGRHAPVARRPGGGAERAVAHRSPRAIGLGSARPNC